MTLILTELSRAGVAMAADSAITYINARGEIQEINQQGWQKLLRVPKINAAISYWGFIGKITTSRFDNWLNQIIQQSREYNDLRSFTDFLTTQLNEATNQKPLGEKEDIGIHVAGFAPWPDQQIRPFFYHVHNGHGRYKFTTVAQPNHLAKIKVEWVSDPRELFLAHQDFPHLDKSLEENLTELQLGYTTRNGCFLLYAVMWQELSKALLFMNSFSDISVPRNPEDIRSRKGLLHILLQSMIRIYECSNQNQIIGGQVTSLAIRENGFVNE